MKSYIYHEEPKTIISSLQDFKTSIDKSILLKNFKEISSKNFYNGYYHRPEYLHFLEEGFEDLFQAIKNNKNILILPDYDSDGTNSGTIYYNFLTLLKGILGSSSEIKIKPTCRDEGYGISNEFFQSNIYQDFDIILTTDIGISVSFPFDFILEKKVLIYDHHLPLTSIWFSIKEIREKVLEKYVNINLNRTKFDNDEEKKEIVLFALNEIKKLFQQRNLEFSNDSLKQFIENLKINNFVLNYYDHYFSGFRKDKDEFTLKNREEFDGLKENENIKNEYSIHFYSSAGQLAVQVCGYYIEKLIGMGLLHKDLSKVKNIYLIMGCVTAISDVTNLESKNNLAFYIYGSKIFNTIRSKYQSTRSNFHSTENCCSNILGNLFFNKDLKTTQEFFKHIQSLVLTKGYDVKWINFFSNQLLTILKFYLYFDVDFNKTSLGFSIGPYINSFGRLVTTHSLFEQFLLGRQMNKKTNDTRKQFQKDITEVIKLNIQEDERNYSETNNNNIIIGGTEKAGDFSHEYRLLKKKYSENSKLFVDYTDEIMNTDEINISVESIEETIKNKSGVVGIIASKIQEEFKKPAIIGEFEEGTKNALHGSGRSNFSLIDLGIGTFKSVTNVGGHGSAFGITINDIELFKQEYNKRLSELSDQEIQNLYHVYYDFLIEVSSFDEYNEIIKELNEFFGMIKYKISFKKMLKNFDKNNINLDLFFNNNGLIIGFSNQETKYKTWNYRLTFGKFFKNKQFKLDDIKDILYSEHLEPSSNF